MAITLDELISEGERIYANRHESDYGRYVENDTYDPWKRKALMFIQQAYPKNPQVVTFESHVAANDSIYHCLACLSILKAFRDIQPKDVDIDYEGLLNLLFERFHMVARQIRRRHDGRDTLMINDEYDVQDMLHALLKLHFDDVRPEEWTPSYAGGANRMDFLLKDEEIAIEIKMTRSGLKDKELGDQLIIDIAKYQNHPNCKCLYCFVYDPDDIIRNPRGIEKDLEKLGKDFPVKVYIRPMN